MLDSIRANAQSFGVKLAFGIIILVFVFWGIGSYNAPSHVVATVNGKNISAQEFSQAYGQLEQNFRQYYPGIEPEMLRALQLEQQALHMLVEQKMLEAESERTGIDVSPYELFSYLDSMGLFAGDDGRFSSDVYLSMLESWGQTPGTFEEGVRRQLLSQKFQTLLSANAYDSPVMARALYDYQGQKRAVSYIFFPAEAYADAAVPTEEEILQSYADRADLYALAPQVRLEYVVLDPLAMGDISAISDEAVAQAYENQRARFSTPEQVQARHILVMVNENASAEAVQEAEAAILAIRERIESGESFAAVAMETGQDGTAAQGGDLGWFTREQMVTPFADAAFSLEPGVLSEPVRTRFGFHLILVEDRQEAHVQSLEEATPELRQFLAAQAASQSLQTTANEVLAAALGGKSMEEAAAMAGLVAENSGLVMAGDLGSLLGLKPVDVQTIMTAPEGQVIGSVLETERGAVVIRVAESLPASTRPLDEVREDIIFWLTRTKSRELAKAEAEQIRTSFDGSLPSVTLASQVQTSEPFARGGYIPELGMSMELVRDIFLLPAEEANTGAWLEEAYIVDEGAVLVNLARVEAPSEEEWLAQGPELQAMLIQERSAQLYQAYRSRLLGAAEVKVLAPELLAR